MNLTADARHRTPLWYASRINHPEFADKAYLEKALTDAGGQSALACGKTLPHIGENTNRL